MSTIPDQDIVAELWKPGGPWAVVCGPRIYFCLEYFCFEARGDSVIYLLQSCAALQQLKWLLFIGFCAGIVLPPCVGLPVINSFCSDHLCYFALHVLHTSGMKSLLFCIFNGRISQRETIWSFPMNVHDVHRKKITVRAHPHV